MKTTDLLERRTRLVAEMRSITEAPAGAGGDLSAEQGTKFETMKTELATLEKSIDRRRLVDEAERRMTGEQIAGGSGDNRLDAELRSCTLRRFILSQVPGHGEDCSREREVSSEYARRSGRQFQGICVPVSVLHQPVERRVLTSDTGTAGSGGDLIGTDLMGNLYIDALRTKLVTRRLGATILSNLTANVDIPRLTATATGHWVAENSAISPSDEEFDAVQLRPKHVGAITEFSRNMLMQSSPDVETLIRNDFAQVLARAVDRAAIVGGGSEEPIGVIANTSVNHSVSFAIPSWQNVLQLIETVEAADATGSGFICDAHVTRKLRTTAIRSDAVITLASFIVGENPGSMAGYPLAQTNLCPAETIIFGNWADCLIGYWSEIDILVNPFESVAYSKGNVQVRGMITSDVALRHAESFAYSDDVNVDPIEEVTA